MTDTTGEATSQKKGLPSALQQMLKRMAGDMKLLGIAQIIYGGLYCLSIVGAPIGVPVIIAGMRLKESGETFVGYAESADSARLKQALELQARFFRIMKILFFVGLGLAALSILLLILFSMFAALSYTQ